MNALSKVQEAFAQSESQHADYHEWLDSVDPCTCSRAEMLELMEQAPDAIVQGMLYGIYMMRTQMAVVTGRDYE